MQHKFVPRCARGKEAKFEGHVMLKVPTFDQRYEMIGECGFVMDESGEISKTAENTVGPMRQMVKLSKKFVAEVDLTLKDDGTQYKDYDSMTYDPACDEVLFEIAGMMLQGFRPTKNSKGS